jgi:phosphoglycerate kinase
VVVLGGAKIKDKLPLIKNFLEKADYILLGGGLANTILKAWGFKVGKSLYEKEMIEEAKNLGSKKAELILPGDFLVIDNKKNKKRNLGEIKDNDIIVDIGPIALSFYKKILKEARTILFNGPLGKIENGFHLATKGVLEEIFNNSKALAVIGGGDTLKCLKLFNLEKKKGKNIFLSTGGGAMLKYLADEELEAIKVIFNQK